MTAPEANPDDTSYWDPPPAAPKFLPLEPKRKKKGEKRPRFRTTTVPPSSDFTMIDIRPLYKAEKKRGKPTAPMFVNGWEGDRDPRFCDPLNPLYDPSASRATDWREKLDIVSYLRFTDYVAQTNSMPYRYVIESNEDEELFDERLMQKLRGMDVKPDPAASKPLSESSGQTDSNRNGSLSSRSSGIPVQASCDLPNTPSSSSRDTKASTVKDHRVGGVPATTTAVQSVDHVSASRKTSEKTCDNGESAGNESKVGNTDTGAAVITLDEPPVDKETGVEVLRTCARCEKQETTSHEFKKCKKCKELNIKDAKYYCGRDCQVQDWTERHRQEHRDWQRLSPAVAPSVE